MQIHLSMHFNRSYGSVSFSKTLRLNQRTTVITQSSPLAFCSLSLSLFGVLNATIPLPLSFSLSSSGNRRRNTMQPRERFGVNDESLKVRIKVTRVLQLMRKMATYGIVGRRTKDAAKGVGMTQKRRGPITRPPEYKQQIAS